MSELTVGSKAPAFSAPDESGKKLSLSDFAGKTVVLFFYPKDLTPGCTVEACSFRDEYQGFKKLGAIVLGVSPDDSTSHTKFIEKHSLPYPLLADTDKKISQAYGVWVEKSMYGKKYMGVERSTFVIGADGKIAQVFRKVKPETHTADVIAALKSMPAPAK